MIAGGRPLAQMLGATLALATLVGPTRAQGPKAVGTAGLVVVSLRPSAVVATPQVLIRDVAVCEGGSAALREQIARLDLADLPADGQTVSIAQEQVYYRIRISGIDPKQFRLRGPAVVAVKFPRYLVTEDDVLTVAKKAVLECMPESAKDVTVKLSQPVRGLMVVPGAREQVSFEAEFRPGTTPLNKVRVEVNVLVNSQRHGSVPVSLDVQVHQQVAVCKQRIERGESLTKDKVQFERRVIESFKEYLAPAQGLAGKRANNALAAGQLITAADIEAIVTEAPVVVKQQALVKLVAKLGSFQLVAIGEALQEGRTGQLIRVRNIDSQNVVVGRVVGRSVVEVEY
jgi:flagella basal body P-ring formation protein FlgA